MTPPSNPERPPLETAKRQFEVDMSPEAIDRRPRDLRQLHKVWQRLRNFRPVEPKTPSTPPEKDSAAVPSE